MFNEKKLLIMDYEKLKEVIAKQIKENGRGEITGPVLQAVLMAMVDILGEVYPQTYTDEEKAQARANIDALSNHNGEITKEKLSLEVQAILNDVANKQDITDASLATIAKTIVGAINELFNGGVKDKSITTSKIEDGAITDAKIASGAVTTPKIANDAVTTEKVNDGAITEPKLDTDLANVITSAVQPADLASAIATALASYVAKSDIVDTTGSATDKVMSQHGVTEAINGVADKVTDLAEEVDGKQDALTLTVKDNGNIVIANIQGQSKEFIPATPSGDPMHYAYVTAGAEYNDTGADIVKTTPWADMLDDDYTGDYGKTVVHKAGYWYLNGLGDITNEQMCRIYGLTLPLQNNWTNILAGQDVRTNLLTIIPSEEVPTNLMSVSGNTFRRSNIEVINVLTNFNRLEYSLDMYIIYGLRLRHVLGVIKSSGGTYYEDRYLMTIKIYSLKNNVNFYVSKMISTKSVLYMINNEAATSPITINLHADVYNRCMANADILDALQAHTNVSLASA